MQNFWVKTYKRDQWNLPNILAYISGIFDGFFQSWVSPFNLSIAFFGNLEPFYECTKHNLWMRPQILREFCNPNFGGGNKWLTCQALTSRRYLPMFPGCNFHFHNDIPTRFTALRWRCFRPSRFWTVFFWQTFHFDLAAASGGGRYFRMGEQAFSGSWTQVSRFALPFTLLGNAYGYVCLWTSIKLSLPTRPKAGRVFAEYENFSTWATDRPTPPQAKQPLIWHRFSTLSLTDWW